MKKVLKTALILMFPFVISSCSKSDDDERAQDVKEAIIRVEVTTNQAPSFEESLAIQVVGNAMTTTDVTGADWDEVKVNLEAKSKTFVKQGDTKPTVVYQTTNKVGSFTYSATITNKPGNTIPLITTIKYYADGKMIDEKTVTTTPETPSYITIPIVVTNL